MSLTEPEQADWGLASPPFRRRGQGKVAQGRGRDLFLRSWCQRARHRAHARVVAAVVHKQRVLFDMHWQEAVLGLENHRRRLQAHVAQEVTSEDPLPVKPVNWGDLRRLEPISPVWGCDRGQPVDRYYIERFLQQHRDDIRGRVLEVKDAGYTRAYGGPLESSDVVDIAQDNASATLVSDLAARGSLPEDTFDCFILDPDPSYHSRDSERRRERLPDPPARGRGPGHVTLSESDRLRVRPQRGSVALHSRGGAADVRRHLRAGTGGDRGPWQRHGVHRLSHGVVLRRAGTARVGAP